MHRPPSDPHEIVMADLVLNEAADNRMTPQAKASLIERVLSPQSIQWMMATGGGLLAVGLATWLWSIGVFENPMVVAVVLGTTNLIVLGLGIWVHQRTRHELVGRGVTLLASLLLPLNLWLYDSQGLIVLEAGGQLWIPALVCCLIYAVVARVTQDSMSVYTLVGGVVLTGLLFLAGPSVALFWSALPTATFLIVVAVACIAAERAFVESDSPFSRQRFGLAFFMAGHIVLIGGLGCLLAGHTTSLLSELLPSSDVHLLTSRPSLGWAIGLIVIAMATYAYSHVTRRCGLTFGLAVVALAAWSVALTLHLFAIPITVSLVLLVAGVAVVACNVICPRLPQPAVDGNPFAVPRVIDFALPIAAVCLTLVAVAHSLVVLSLNQALFVSWQHAAQIFVAAAACWTLPKMWQGNRDHVLDGCFNVGVVALVTGIMAVCSGLPFVGVGAVGLVAIAVPAALCFVAFGLSAEGQRQRLEVGGIVATSAIVTLWIATVLAGAVPHASWSGAILLATVSITYFYIGLNTSHRWSLVPATGTMLMTTGTIFVLCHVNSPFTWILTTTVLGVTLTFAVRVLDWIAQQDVVDDGSESSVQRPLEVTAALLVVAGSLAGVLYSLANLIVHDPSTSDLLLLTCQLLALPIAYLFTRDDVWKRTFIACAVVTVVMVVVSLVSLSQLALWQRFEVFSLGVGSILVLAGYIGWSMEDESKNDAVTLQLVFGSLCLVVPLSLGLLVDRMTGSDTGTNAWRYVHEIGCLTFGLLLLGSGVLCRVRSTTLLGGLLVTFYVVSLVFLIHWPEQLQSAAVLMMIGGAAFFSIAVALSIYRDRLLMLPQQIRDGKGVFSVVKWR